MTRYLAIDHGTRRIGLAIGDSQTRMAFARPALRHRGEKDAVARIRDLAERDGVDTILLGLPLNDDGSEGPQAAAARAFGARLADVGLAVDYVDERLSSWQASAELAAAGRRPGRRSGELDSAAARIFLQEYLDAREPPPGDPEESA